MIHLSHIWLAKEKQIELYLKEGFSLTVQEAAEKFGHWRLPVVVNRLRNKGVPIQKVLQDGKAIYWVKQTQNT